MKNKRIFVAALLLAAAAFLFTACTQSGNSSGSSNTTNNGGNNGGNTTQNSLQQVWKLNEVKVGQESMVLPEEDGGEDLYIFLYDGYAYNAWLNPQDKKLYKEAKVKYTVAGSNITITVPPMGPGQQPKDITVPFKIEVDKLTIEAADQSFVLKGTKSSDYSGDQIKNAQEPPEYP